MYVLERNMSDGIREDSRRAKKIPYEKTVQFDDVCSCSQNLAVVTNAFATI